MFISQVRYPTKIEFGFEHRAAGSCPVAKRMSEKFGGISDLRDFIYQLNIVKIQKPENSNRISINWKNVYLSVENKKDTESLKLKQYQYDYFQKQFIQDYLLG